MTQLFAFAIISAVVFLLLLKRATPAKTVIGYPGDVIITPLNKEAAREILAEAVNPEDERAPNVLLEGAQVQLADGRMAAVATGGYYHVPLSCKIVGTLKIAEGATVTDIKIKIYSFGFVIRDVTLNPVGEESVGGGYKRLTFSSIQAFPGGIEVRVSKAVIEVHSNQLTVTKTVDGPITFNAS